MGSVSKLKSVKKLVIPVAGMGTRFMPVTKSVPKELLPVLGKPIIQYIVEEAVAAGIENIVLVCSPQKTAINDFFDLNSVAEFKLKQKGKDRLTKEWRSLLEKISISCVFQQEPKGLGHAILQAQSCIGADEDFAVSLGDDIMLAAPGQSCPIGQCIEAYKKSSGKALVGLIEVPKSEVNRYGIAEFKSGEKDRELAQAKSFIEKPSIEDAPSNWAIPGRYVFNGAIFKILATLAPSKDGEIQLTDAIQKLCQEGEVYTQKLKASRYDTGYPLGFLKANLSLAMQDPEMRKELIEIFTETPLKKAS